MEFFTIFILCCLAPYAWSRNLLEASPSIFDVADYGAVGDGSTDDTQAFADTWGAMCGANTSNATYYVSGGSFLSSFLHFKGPCKSPTVNVSIQGNMIAPVKSDGPDNQESWISFSNVNGLLVDGRGGQLDGSGNSWWQCAKLSPLELKGCNRPTLLKFHACNNLTITGVTSMNSPSNHISINACNGTTISNVSLTAPGNSPNTDGIDISNSSNILVQDSFIGTGDDCIAINSYSSAIKITNITCGPGHGISVGSLGKDDGGVEDVHVSNCTLNGTTNGVRIKTFKKGSGFVKNITFENITMNNVKNPIIIDQNYCALGCNTKGAGVQVSNVTYIGIHGTSAKQKAIIIDCNKKMPCINIVLKDINITDVLGGPTTAICNYANGRSTSTVPAVPCLAE